MAVPVMTSFAVQAVTSILSYLSNRRLQAREDAHMQDGLSEDKEKRLKPHAELVQIAHDRFDELTQPSRMASNQDEAQKSLEDVTGSEEILADRILSLATKVRQLPWNSKALRSRRMTA